METILFSPYRIRDIELKNRIVMSPMCMHSSYHEDGHVGDFHLVHYTSRAVGQVGLVMLEATAVSPQGRITAQDLGIWSDEHLPGLTRLVQMMKAYGAKTAIQLAHAGRKAQVSGEIIAPSAIPFDVNMRTPKEMSLADIQLALAQFKEGARRAKEAGFDVIELHAAHGYLINSFLSPLTNQREDEYGGGVEQRYRFLREAIEAVQEVWDGPLLVRISAHEYHPAGLTITDYISYAEWMKAQGVDLIDVSSGAVVPAHIDVYPGYQVEFAAAIKQGTEMPSGAVGLITSGEQAEEILRNGQADLIFVGRELLRDPYWPRTAAKELGVDLEAPGAYRRGW